MPGITVSALYVLTCLVITAVSHDLDTISISMRKLRYSSLQHLPKFTQLLHDQTRIQTQTPEAVHTTAPIICFAAYTVHTQIQRMHTHAQIYQTCMHTLTCLLGGRFTFLFLRMIMAFPEHTPVWQGCWSEINLQIPHGLDNCFHLGLPCLGLRCLLWPASPSSGLSEPIGHQLP